MLRRKMTLYGGLCTVSVVVWGLCLSLMVARMGCTFSKSRTDYIRKFEQGHRPRGPHVAHLSVLEVRVRIVARASLAYGSSLKYQIRKHYFRLGRSNRGPDGTHTHSTRIRVSGVYLVGRLARVSEGVKCVIGPSLHTISRANPACAP